MNTEFAVVAERVLEISDFYFPLRILYTMPPCNKAHTLEINTIIPAMMLVSDSHNVNDFYIPSSSLEGASLFLFSAFHGVIFSNFSYQHVNIPS